MADRLGGMRLAVAGGGNGGGEEVFQLEDAAGRRHVLVRGPARDRRFVHADGVSNRFQVERPEVLDAVQGCGGRAVLTRTDHTSGTDRVAEVAERPDYRDHEFIVNLQGDELFLPPSAVAEALERVRSGIRPDAAGSRER